jgi:hypothetical protein
VLVLGVLDVVVVVFFLVVVVTIAFVHFAGVGTAVFTDIPIAFATPMHRSAQLHSATAHVATKRRMICNVKNCTVLLGAEHNTPVGQRSNNVGWLGFRERRRHSVVVAVVVAVVVVVVVVDDIIVLFLQEVVIIDVIVIFRVVVVVDCGYGRRGAVLTDIPIAGATPMHGLAKLKGATAHVASKCRLICNMKNGSVLVRTVNT